MFPPLITTPTFVPPTRPSSSSTAASAAAPAPSASSFVRSSSTTIGRVIEQLERESPLPCDHIVVVERVHVRPLPVARDLERGGVRLVVALPCKHRLRARALDRSEFRERDADW